MIKLKYRKQSAELIQWYCEGSDLTPEQLHVLTDTAEELGGSLRYVYQEAGFIHALAENLQALDCFEVRGA